MITKKAEPKIVHGKNPKKKKRKESSIALIIENDIVMMTGGFPIGLTDPCSFEINTDIVYRQKRCRNRKFVCRMEETRQEKDRIERISSKRKLPICLFNMFYLQSGKVGERKHLKAAQTRNTIRLVWHECHMVF